MVNKVLVRYCILINEQLAVSNGLFQYNSLELNDWWLNVNQNTVTHLLTCGKSLFQTSVNHMFSVNSCYCECLWDHNVVSIIAGVILSNSSVLTICRDFNSLL